MRVYFYNSDSYKNFTDAYAHGAVYRTGGGIDAADPMIAEANGTIPMGDLLECLDAQLQCLGECYGTDQDTIVAGVILPETKKFISLRELYSDLADHSYNQIVAKQKQGA